MNNHDLAAALAAQSLATEADNAPDNVISIGLADMECLPYTVRKFIQQAGENHEREMKRLKREHGIAVRRMRAERKLKEIWRENAQRAYRELARLEAERPAGEDLPALVCEDV